MSLRTAHALPAVLALATSACTLLFPDPPAPAPERPPEPGRVEGQVWISEVEATPELLRSVTVELLAEGEEAETQSSALPDGEGAFVFERVEPGRYALWATRSGFFDPLPPRQLEVGEGELVRLAPVVLEVDRRRGLVWGRARVQGGLEMGHGGIVVEAEGTPYTAVTARDGSWRLELPPRNDGYVLIFGKQGHSQEQRRVAALAPDQEIELEEVLLVGEPGRLEGRVRLLETEADGELLRSVRVELRAAGQAELLENMAPDDQGHFVFAGLAAGSYDILATRSGFEAAERLAVGVPVGGAVDAGVLSLRPDERTAVVRGVARVRGAPLLANAGTLVEAETMAVATVTTRAGSWELELSPRDDGYTLVFSRAGYVEQRHVLESLPPDAVVEVPEILLEGQPASIHGKVELQPPAGAQQGFDPELLTGVRVELQDPDEPEPPLKTTAPGLDGRFQFDDLAEGSYLLLFELRGFRPGHAAATMGPGDVVQLATVALQPELSEGASIQGQALLDCPGDCEHGGLNVEALRTPFVTQTAADGQFLLPVVEGVYDLRVSSPGYEDAQLDAVAVGASEAVVLERPLTLQLRPATLHGRILRGRPDGETVAAPGSAVSVRAAEGAQPVLAGLAGEDGELLLSAAMLGGAYVLRVVLDQHDTLSLPIRMVPGEQTELGDLVLQRQRGSVVGRVLREGSAAPGGAVIVATGDITEPELAGLRWVAASEPPGDTFRLEGLPVGLLRLSASAYDHLAPDPVPVRVAPGGQAEVDLTLTQRVHRLEVDPVVGAFATLRFLRDEDLTHARVWWDQDDPPEDAPFVELGPLGADELQVDLCPAGHDATAGGCEREFRLRAQLANEVYLQEPGSPSAALTPVLEATTLRDTQPPAAGEVTVGNGEPVVHALTLPVTIRNTQAWSMSFWNGAADGEQRCQQAPACARPGEEPDPRLQPFTNALTHTLGAPEPEEPTTEQGYHQRVVCWRFCDQAGNGVDGQAALLLGTYLTRPTPWLDARRSDAERQLGDEATVLVVYGRGIAADSVLQVGELFVTCGLGEDEQGGGEEDSWTRWVPYPGALRCQASDVEATCETRCAVDLSEQPSILRKAGTYPLRLHTPQPVQDGVQASREVAFLDVSAPLPIIQAVDPRGMAYINFQDPDILGAFFYYGDTPPEALGLAEEFPASVDVTVTACDLADNAQFRLGHTVGEIIEDEEVAGAGPCECKAARRVRLLFESTGLDVDAPPAVVVVNPSPGGGEARTPFGLTSPFGSCLESGVCVSDLAGSRPAPPDGQGVLNGFKIPEQSRLGALRWSGGDRAEIRRSYEADDIPNVLLAYEQTSLGLALARLLVRVNEESSGGVLPTPLGWAWVASISASDGTQPRVLLSGARRRNDGRFGPAPELGCDEAAGLEPGDDRLAEVVAEIGRRPRDIQLADLDGDSRLDLVTANCSANGVTVALGVGDGGFDAAAELLMGRCPTQLRVMDLDGDTHPDIVTASSDDGRVNVRLGRGDGTFSLNVPYGTGEATAGLALGDLNGDGYPDVVATSPNASSVTVRLGLGDGRFGPLRELPLQAWYQPERCALADMDGDGRLDLITTERRVCSDAEGEPPCPFDVDAQGAPLHPDAPGHQVVVRRGWPGGCFSETQGYCPEVEEGDSGGGGVGQPCEPEGDIVFGDDGATAPGLAAISLGGVGPARELAIADLDGNGARDIVVAVGEPEDADDGAVVLVALGTGGGAFGPTRSTALQSPASSLRVAELTGDGVPDLALGTDSLTAPAAALLLIGDGAGGFTQASCLPVSAAAGATALALADVDADGTLDLLAAVRESDGARVRLRRHLGQAAFPQPRQDLNAGRDPTALVVADLDGDAHADLLVASSGSDELRPLLAAGDGGFAPLPPVAGFDGSGAGANTWAVQATDLTRDGRPELLTLSEASSWLQVYTGVDALGPPTWAPTFGTDHEPTPEAPSGLWLGDCVDDLCPGILSDGRDRFVVVDIDGDGELEVVFGTCRGDVAVLQAAHTPGQPPELRVDRLQLDPLGDGEGPVERPRCPTEVEVVDVDGRWGLVTLSGAALLDDGTPDPDWARQGVTVHLPSGAPPADRLTLPTFDSYDLPFLKTDWRQADPDIDLEARLSDNEARARQLLRSDALRVFELDAGDMDDDGVDDLIVLADSGEWAAKRSRTKGIWRPLVTGPWTEAHLLRGAATALPDFSASMSGAGAIGDWQDDSRMSTRELRSLRHADLNGDGWPEQMDLMPQHNLLRVMVGSEGQGAPAYRGADRFYLSVLAEPEHLEVADLDADGSQDLIITNRGDGSVSILRLPAPGRWAQTLRDPDVPETEIPWGGGRTWVEFSSAMHRVERAVVRVRLVGERLDGVGLRLEIPNGDTFTLAEPGDAPAGTVWAGHFPLQDLGMQVSGEWRLGIDNEAPGDLPPGTPAPRLQDFTVLTYGSFYQATPGSRAQRPRPFRFGPGAHARRVRETTLGGIDTGDPTCAPAREGASSGPERWYELVLPAARTLSVELAAGFSAAVELWPGHCEQRPAANEVLCQPVPWPAGELHSLATLDAGRLAAGTYCLRVDGVATGTDRTPSGRFELGARIDEPLSERECAEGCEEPEPETVACGPDFCVVPDRLCCVTFFPPDLSCQFACPGGGPLRCDGPEDCPAPQRCCSYVNQLTMQAYASCEDTCQAAEDEVCHTDEDCSAGTCTPQQYPLLGTVHMCR